MAWIRGRAYTGVIATIGYRRFARHMYESAPRQLTAARVVLVAGASSCAVSSSRGRQRPQGGLACAGGQSCRGPICTPGSMHQLEHERPLSTSPTLVGRNEPPGASKARVPAQRRCLAPAQPNRLVCICVTSRSAHWPCPLASKAQRRRGGQRKRRWRDSNPRSAAVKRPPDRSRQRGEAEVGNREEWSTVRLTLLNAIATVLNQLYGIPGASRAITLPILARRSAERWWNRPQNAADSSNGGRCPVVGPDEHVRGCLVAAQCLADRKHLVVGMAVPRR